MLENDVLLSLSRDLDQRPVRNLEANPMNKTALLVLTPLFFLAWAIPAAGGDSSGMNSEAATSKQQMRIYLAAPTGRVPRTSGHELDPSIHLWLRPPTMELGITKLVPGHIGTRSTLVPIPSDDECLPVPP